MAMKRFSPRRVMTHLLLGGMAAMLYLLITLLLPREKRVALLIVVSGYFSLLLICGSLLIGPLNLLRLHRNPMNLDLRRDIGIWAGITGCWHVVLVLRGSILHGQVLLYFLQEGCCGYVPRLNLFGMSNDLGLFATLLLLLLLVLSNTFSLRLLKGKRWKQIQRLTYLLVLFAMAHTFGYQDLNLRGPFLVVCVIVLLILVLVCQGLGIVLTRSRQQM